MTTTMRTAVGTLIAAAVCTAVAVLFWILPFLLSKGHDPNETGWVVLVLYSILPAAMAGILYLISAIFFLVALTGRHPR